MSDTLKTVQGFPRAKNRVLREAAIPVAAFVFWRLGQYMILGATSATTQGKNREDKPKKPAMVGENLKGLYPHP